MIFYGWRIVAAAFLVLFTAYGAQYSFPAAVADFFGRSAAGSIVGFLFMAAGSMAAWGPLAAGAMFDATGSYAPAFQLSAASNLVAALVLATLRMPAR